MLFHGLLVVDGHGWIERMDLSADWFLDCRWIAAVRTTSVYPRRMDLLRRLLERAIEHRASLLAKGAGLDVAHHADDPVGSAAAGDLLSNRVLAGKDALGKGAIDDGGLWSGGRFPAKIAAGNAGMPMVSK
jgi:hypothetical protein